MRAKVFFILSLFYTSLYGTGAVSDTIVLPDVEVSVSRLTTPVTKQQLQVSVLDGRLVEQAHVGTPKEVSGLAPNVYMPDYGSAMTSSIYIRGMGSRINEPVMAMLVDGVPLLDKNMYDYMLQDVKRIELLRGSQGSLYGRNSPAGVMEIRTMQPLDFTTRNVRGQLTYGTANTIRAQASYYEPVSASFGIGIAGRYARTDGFHTNSFDNTKVDYGQQAGGRIVLDGKPSDEWRMTGNVFADWVRQGAFPYADAATGIIAYNAPGGYERLALLPSLRADYRHDGYTLQLAASYQFMRDDMRMDNDYTTSDIFTLQQAQRQHNATLDAVLSAPKPCAWYEWTLGVSGFAKANTMQAPVVFMREGIDELILSNANRGIQTVFPDDSICISNTTLPVPSSFDLFNGGAAVYHQSNFQLGRWHLNAGVRIDYEYTRMAYLSTADVNYRFTMLMKDYKDVHTVIKGTQADRFIQVLPKLAVSYERTWVTVYGYAAKGYKAGGYNPQIFSTITQNQVMTDMAADMGLHLNIADPRFSDVAITKYKPETDWTFEAGAHFTPAEGLKIDMDAFHIQCFDQQVTVFPNGRTTGRMMANAAHSRIWGAEAALQYRWNKCAWQGILHASYGFTDARFVAFNDGMGDYSGHVIPYAPRHTARVLFIVDYRVGRKWLESVGLTVKGDGIGRIYWNERNDCWQPFYGLLGVTLNFEWQYVQLQIWGRNLTGTHYDVFYFRSMDRDFLQRGKPLESGATVLFDI
ncbi:MAG: TonB-dependent receptor [Paludibacteraceae bacterium]|nr:TonB-dependent receptor [Paludibacteraceae bacterium]